MSHMTELAAATTGHADNQARPYWLSAPCPAWCAITHREDDAGEDRMHATDERDSDITLTTEDIITLRDGCNALHQPPQLHTWLEQGYRESDPRIMVAAETTTPGRFSMTLDEAEAFARSILAGVAAARAES